MIVEVLPKVNTQGMWVEAIRSNEGITGGIQKSASRSDSKSITKADSAAITASFETGFIFEGSSVSSTISHEASKTVGEVLEHSESISCQASCENPRKEQVVLFQWKTISENVDGPGNLASVNTCQYICRYGVDAQSPPKCPPQACKDGPCN